MKRGQRAKADMYDDWCSLPIEGTPEKIEEKNLTNYEIVDVINIFMQNEKGEQINCWTNPKYEKREI